MKNIGFTLIELLVVVLIIGILAAIALPQYQTAVAKSRAAEALINVRALSDTVQRYVLETGSYPDNFSQLDAGFGQNCSGQDCVHGGYCYTLQYVQSQKQVGAYAGNDCSSRTVLSFSIFFEDTVYSGTNMLRGDLACNTRNNDAFKRICLSLGGKSTYTYSGTLVYLLNR